MEGSRKKTKGLGDVIETITESIGIEKCNKCEERKTWLNVNFPFNKPKPLNDEQKQRIQTEPLKVYNEVFGTNIDAELFKDGVEKAILKKLNKLSEYEN